MDLIMLMAVLLLIGLTAVMGDNNEGVVVMIMMMVLMIINDGDVDQGCRQDCWH